MGGKRFGSALYSKATWFWQDKLAKFDPKRVDANGFEKEMFTYGAQYARDVAADVIKRMAMGLTTGQSIKSEIEQALRKLDLEIEGDDVV